MNSYKNSRVLNYHIIEFNQTEFLSEPLRNRVFPFSGQSIQFKDLLLTLVKTLYRDQVVDILKMSGNADFFSPEMDVIRYKDSDPGLDLLGALLAVSFENIFARPK